jgi:hypothetical protein
MQGNCVKFQFLKPYLMYSATDAASAVVDFAKGNVEDKVVDSPPSCSASETPSYLPFPLWECQSTPIWQRSRSPTHQNVHTRQRQLYCKASLCNSEEVKEKDPIHYNVNFFVEPAIVSHVSQSHASSLICDTRRKNYCLQAGLPTLLGVSHVLSPLYLRLFGNVGSRSMHPLGFVAWRPILAEMRSLGGWQSWSHRRWTL